MSLQFTEEMKGYISFGADDYLQGAQQGRESGTPFMFHLTILVDSVEQFVRDPLHRATAAGWVRCDALGGRLPVQGGRFNLFVQEGDPGLRRMLYRLHFRDVVGHPLTMFGYKTVTRQRRLSPLDVWPDTTTLFTRIVRGHVDAESDGEPELVASGVLRIHPRDFARQLTTFRTRGPTRRERRAGLYRFGRLFAGELWDVYTRPRAVAPAKP